MEVRFVKIILYLVNNYTKMKKPYYVFVINMVKKPLKGITVNALKSYR